MPVAAAGSGVARLAGGILKAFGAGLSGKKLASLGTVGVNGSAAAIKIPKVLSTANTAGRFFDSPIGNYATNTVLDAGFGMLWGENPLNALGRSAIGNIGGTIGQKTIGAGLDRLGASKGIQEITGSLVVNPLAYSLTEMGAMKVVPGLYGLDANGNYVGNQQQEVSQTQLNPEQQQAAMLEQMAMMAQNPSGLSQLDRQTAQADFYFDQQEKQRRAEQKLAKDIYRRSLEQQYSGLPAEQQMYGGFR
jgi:hypothetical protein